MTNLMRDDLDDGNEAMRAEVATVDAKTAGRSSALHDARRTWRVGMELDGDHERGSRSSR